MENPNIVKHIFDEVRKKIPPPHEQTPQQSSKYGLFSTQSKKTNATKSFLTPKPVPKTPSRNKFIIHAPKTVKTPTRVPRTPQYNEVEKTQEISTPKPSFEKKKRSTSDIKVYLRIKPLDKSEEPADFEINGNEISFSSSEHQYSFDHIYNEDCYQDEVFQGVVWPFLRNFISGKDGILFSYGAPKSGKSFTLQGTEENPGLIQRIIKTILSMNDPNGFERGIFLSCVEIYNERIQDLLSESNIPLRIGKDALGCTTVKNVAEIEIKMLESIKDILESIKKRMNTKSHIVFSIKLITIPIDSKTGKRSEDMSKIRSSRLSLVELSPSERFDALNKSNHNANESINVNKSIHVLSRCFREMLKKKEGSKVVQIPYRESKITELFKDFFDPSLKKETFCSLIINISQCGSQLEDTLSSLQFAADSTECEIKRSEEEEEEDENFAVRKLNFDDEEDGIVEKIKQEAKNKEEAETKMRQELYGIYMSKLQKINEISENQIEQVKEQQTNSLPTKLSEIITSQAKQLTEKRELEEMQREINRLKIIIQEKDAHLNSITDKMDQMVETLKAVVQDTSEKSEQRKNLEERAQRILSAAKKEQQEIISLQKTHQKAMMNLRAEHENKLFELQARKYKASE